jgi:DNA-binding NtrC family response regulator
MIATERVQAALDRIRPDLSADGADVEPIAIDDNAAAVRLTGVSAGPTGDKTPPAIAAAAKPAPSPSAMEARGGNVPSPLPQAPISLDDRLRELEAHLITWALGVTGGNKSKAAGLLRIKRSTLGDRIARCGLNHAVAAEGGGPMAATVRTTLQ